MKLRLSLAAVAFSIIAMQAAFADPESCKTVRFGQIAWTDLQSTTGLATTVLEGLGYEPKITDLELAVAFQGLKNKDLDVFLGNWMPSQTSQIEPYTKEGSIDTVTANLEGAGYGLVVPQYVADGGVKDLKDIGKHGDKFNKKIYGIEPGNDGNKIVQGFIADKANNLDGFQLVESSEAGMLTEAKKDIKNNKWIVFLGWTPHPVMGKMNLVYLSGMGDSGFGSATVFTNTRAGYVKECPNIGKLLANLKFTVDMEGQIMADILDKKTKPKDAATAWLKANPAVLDSWLAGVTTVSGEDGEAAVKKSLGL
ncbi:MAG TPA: choline ABC transporter substrate-binding protein [Dongiaceae bacterium]|nr:choline ABC transporter substrate-binding protein [Dongiaceae bacterium]